MKPRKANTAGKTNFAPGQAATDLKAKPILKGSKTVGKLTK